MIDKANVTEEGYIYENPIAIMPLRQARTNVIKAIMEPWLPSEKIEFSILASSLHSLEVTKEHFGLLAVMMAFYRDHQGHMEWDVNSIGLLKELLFDILGLSQKVFEDFVISEEPNKLRIFVSKKTKGFELEEVDEICNILTMEEV